jgi:hypothetical protein
MPMPVPNIIGMLPGMTAMATMMMKLMAKEKVASILDCSRCARRQASFMGQMSMDDGHEGRPVDGSSAWRRTYSATPPKTAYPAVPL